MKRIDQKVQEIEKKDKQNRILFIGFVVLILAFMVIVLIYREKLTNERIKTTEIYKQLEASEKSLDSANFQLNASLEKLQNSLDPERYWEITVNDGLVQSYIEYITNEWGIKKTHMNEAITNITSLDGLNGWLFTGNTPSSGYIHKDVVKVVWRQGSNPEDNIEYTQPQKGDVVQLITDINRLTYSQKDKVNDDNYKNSEGWRVGSKAYVTNIEEDPNNTNYYIQIKYY